MSDSKVPDWKPVTRTEPSDDRVVLTKIDDAAGPRNEGKLKRIFTGRGRLWFLADGSMYVYYTPTHFAEVE